MDKDDHAVAFARLAERHAPIDEDDQHQPIALDDVKSVSWRVMRFFGFFGGFRCYCGDR